MARARRHARAERRRRDAERRERREGREERDDALVAQAAAAEQRLDAQRAAIQWRFDHIDAHLSAGFQLVEHGDFSGEIVATRAGEQASYLVVVDHVSNRFTVVETEENVAETLQPDDRIELKMRSDHVHEAREMQVQRRALHTPDRSDGRDKPKEKSPDQDQDQELGRG